MTPRLRNFAMGLCFMLSIFVLSFIIFAIVWSLLPEALQPIWGFAWTVWSLFVLRPSLVDFNSRYFPVSRKNFKSAAE